MKIDIEKIAHLSRLKISQEKSKELEKQLEEILDYFAMIKKIPTEGLEPLVTPHEMERDFREDQAIMDKEFSEEILKRAPETKGRLVKVPPVVGGES